MNRCAEGSTSNPFETPFHNLPEIVMKIKGKVSNAAKLLKGVSGERLRLELEHAMLSLANSLSLLEEEVMLVLKKNHELETRTAAAEQLYREALDKSAAELRDAQRELALQNSRGSKLAKQNEFLNFVNKGLKNQLEQKRRYMDEYRSTHCREVKQIMRALQEEARGGADRIYERFHQVVELCEHELQENRNTEVEEQRLPRDGSQNVLQSCKPEIARPLNQLGTTLKKRSQSACNSGSSGKKRLVETKLAKIVLEQAKLANRNDRYIETYLS